VLNASYTGSETGWNPPTPVLFGGPPVRMREPRARAAMRRQIGDVGCAIFATTIEQGLCRRPAEFDISRPPASLSSRFVAGETPCFTEITAMNSPIIRICPESRVHDADIETLNRDAFGPGRFARTAYRLREGVPHEQELSFIAMLSGTGRRDQLAGSVRQTAIRIGSRTALLLGPLVVATEFKNIGIGRELMNRTIEAANKAGHNLILLVGDYPYYSRFGFQVAPHGTIALPGPVDPRRLLTLALGGNDAACFRGKAMPMLQKNNTR
jgi:predicted N-acetyltransferase YhbS